MNSNRYFLFLSYYILICQERQSIQQEVPLLLEHSRVEGISQLGVSPFWCGHLERDGLAKIRLSPWYQSNWEVIVRGPEPASGWTTHLAPFGGCLENQFNSLAFGSEPSSRQAAEAKRQDWYGVHCLPGSAQRRTAGQWTCPGPTRGC